MSDPGQHTEFLYRLTEQCEKERLTLYEREYNYMYFGSWIIVIGTSKKRIKIYWDGKASHLD
jgi:hypothetical protein